MWAVFGLAEGRAKLGMTIALPAATAGPVTVAASAAGRRLGAWTLTSGQPAYIGRMAKGPVVLEWTGADGKKNAQTAVVVKNVRVELGKK